MLLSSVGLFLAIVYLAMITAYASAWKNTPQTNLPVNWKAATPITVIVPARNEAPHIQKCLASVLTQDYPSGLIEMLVLDDFSADDTALKASAVLNHHPQIQSELCALALIPGPFAANRPNKKAAIEWALARARGDLIVTLDADCVAPPGWLAAIAWRFETDTALQALTGPVLCHPSQRFFDRFQALDLLGLAGITAGGMHAGWHYMGNGAHLAYRKTAFHTVGGYNGNLQIASGDDMFLLEKIRRIWPDSIGYLRHPKMVVRTHAQDTITSFVAQRIRWGGKNAAIPQWGLKLALLSAFLLSWYLLSAWLLVCSGDLPLGGYLAAWGLKTATDFWFLRMLTRYYGESSFVAIFPVALICHVWYVALIGLASLVFKRTQWKGRPI